MLFFNELKEELEQLIKKNENLRREVYDLRMRIEEFISETCK